MAAYLLYFTAWQFQNEDFFWGGEGRNMRNIMALHINVYFPTLSTY
jgi:hypothetical protein